MSKYSNNTGISIPLAVWLATDNYSGGKSDKYPNRISATTLLKSTRQVVLSKRIDPSQETIDISSLVKSRIGSALHDAIESAWKSDHLVKVFSSLGLPENISKRIRVNPYPNIGEEYPQDMIPVWLEQRSYKQLGNWTVIGQNDFIMDGEITDFKSTGTFTYVNSTKNDDYVKQLSVYRWLEPERITSDIGNIDFIFTDFKSSLIGQPNYPTAQTISKPFNLMPIDETESWIKSRLNLIDAYELEDESELPHCTDNELWRSESVWKYYKSGKVEARSTKNFTTAAEAYSRKAEDNNVGLVVEVKGRPTACLYCNVASICSQKDIYIHSGELVI